MWLGPEWVALILPPFLSPYNLTTCPQLSPPNQLCQRCTPHLTLCTPPRPPSPSPTHSGTSIFMHTHSSERGLRTTHTSLMVNYHLAQSRGDPSIRAPLLPRTQTAAHMPIIDESLIWCFTKSPSHFLPLSR